MTDYDQMKNNITGRTPALTASAHRIVDNMQSEEEQWVAGLRKRGFKAAHPNDGWVDRVNKELNLCYPQFDDGVEPGSMVMLGWPRDEKTKDNVPVIITEVKKHMLGDDTYKYEHITAGV